MPFIVDEQQMVEQNLFLYEERLKAPTSRMLDVTQTFVTYFHIDDLESTTDTGFKDIASILGWKSPLRFKKIENFPLYGLEQIVLQLQDTDQGLDTNYEGEATILPSTIKPLPNDLFIIPSLKGAYLFRVTEFQYDNIMTDNFYRISFKLEDIDEKQIEQLNKQTINEYVCSLQNIGTENNCIIEKEVFIDIKKINEMYRRISDFYLSMFYDKRYNALLGKNPDGTYYYDLLQTIFVNKHNLFNEKNNLKPLYLTEHVIDKRKDYKYNKSIYKALELRKLELMNRFPYYTVKGITYKESGFARYYDKSVDVMEIYDDNTLSNPSFVISQDFVDSVRMNIDVEGDYATLIQKFIRNESIKIKDIPFTLEDELIMLNNDMEIFLFTPMIMYIIREVIKKELEKEKGSGF